MQAAVVGLVLAASGVSSALVLFPLHVSSRLCQLRCCPHHGLVAWCSAIFSEGCFYRTLMGSAMSLYVNHAVFIGPCSLVVVAVYSCSTVAFGHCYFGRGAQLPHEPWVIYHGLYVCRRLLLVFCRFAFEQLPQLPCFSAGHWHCLPHHAREQPVVSDVSATPSVFCKEPHAPWGFYQGHF